MSCVLEPVAPALQAADFGPLFAHTRDAVIVGNLATGRIVLWNPAAEALFGTSAEQAIGRAFDSYVPNAVLRLQQAALDLHRRSGQAALIGGNAPIELTVRHHSGAELRVELSLVPLDAPLVMALVRDATPRQHAEQLSRASAHAASEAHAARERLHAQARLVQHGLAELAQPISRVRRSTERLRRAIDTQRREHAHALACALERRAELIERSAAQLADHVALQAGQLTLQPE